MTAVWIPLMFLGLEMDLETRKDNLLVGRILSMNNLLPVEKTLLRDSPHPLQRIGRSQKPKHLKRKLVSSIRYYKNDLLTSVI